MEDFIANLLELFGWAYFQEFSNTMFDEGMYLLPFIVMLIVPLVVSFCFYKIFDSVRGANTTNWIGAGLIGSLITAVVVYFYVNNKDTKLSLDFAGSDIMVFVLITAGYSLVAYVIVSLLMRYLSTNRNHIPFGKAI